VTVLIIFGLRVFYHTVGEGTFHCQRCGGDRRYRLRRGRRFFTLFFVPVIPLNAVGELVQCSTCGTRYRTDVLSLPTAAQMQEALPTGMRAAACVMLRAGDPASGPARQRAVEAITGAGAPGYDAAALDRDLALPPEAAGPALAQVGAQLAVPAREWFLAEVVRIGMADGPLTGTERDAAHWVGAGLGMTQAQALGVIALTEQAAATD
jgi:zinc-ribbon family